MLGSVTNADSAVRRKATDHLLECVDIAKETGSRHLSLWFADGRTTRVREISVSVKPGCRKHCPNCIGQ